MAIGKTRICVQVEDPSGPCDSAVGYGEWCCDEMRKLVTELLPSLEWTRKGGSAAHVAHLC